MPFRHRSLPVSSRKRRLSLDEAIEHGRAHHETAPFRIWDGRFQVAEPEFDDKGHAQRDEDGYLVVAEWHEIAEDFALDRWPTKNWILQ